MQPLHLILNNTTNDTLTKKWLGEDSPHTSLKKARTILYPLWDWQNNLSPISPILTYYRPLPDPPNHTIHFNLYQAPRLVHPEIHPLLYLNSNVLPFLPRINDKVSIVHEVILTWSTTLHGPLYVYKTPIPQRQNGTHHLVFVGQVVRW